MSKSRGPIINNNYQTSIPWLFVAGNALHIHDLADDAYFEGEDAGFSISEYLDNKFDSNGKNIEFKALNGVSYVIPNTVVFPLNHKTLKIKFRPARDYVNRRIVIYEEDKLIYKKFFPFLVPSELVTFSIDSKLLTGGSLRIEVADE